MSRECILVTGGAGYIGSHVCKSLSRAGWRPVVYDNLSRGNEWAVRWGDLVRGDLADRALLEKTLDLYRPIAVVHLAALAYVGESVECPDLYYRNNVGGTLTLLEVCKNAGISRIVFSSSCATYGIPDRLPIAEDMPQVPVNPYGASKLMAERILKDFGGAYGLKSIVLRYFNACGADPEGEIGESHCPETHLVPRALMAAAGALPHVDIFGEDYETPDGTAIRDYVHVTDVAQGHTAALRRLIEGQAFGAYNLGAGRGYSVRDVLRKVEEVTGRKLSVNRTVRRAGDPPVLIADNRLALHELGFEPRHSTLDEIVATAWRWLERSKSLSRNRDGEKV